MANWTQQKYLETENGEATARGERGVGGRVATMQKNVLVLSPYGQEDIIRKKRNTKFGNSKQGGTAETVGGGE